MNTTINNNIAMTNKSIDSQYLKYIIDYSHTTNDKKIKYRCVTNIYLKIYYESSYLLENLHFKNTTVRKAKDLVRELVIEKTKNTNSLDSINYLIDLLSLFLDKYDN